MNRLLVGLSRVVATALLLASPLAHADITIGASFTQTGAGSALGIPSRNAIALFPTQIAGEKIKLVVLDDASDPNNAARNARCMLDEQADVLIGSSSGPTALAMAELAFETQDAAACRGADRPAGRAPDLDFPPAARRAADGRGHGRAHGPARREDGLFYRNG